MPAVRCACRPRLVGTPLWVNKRGNHTWVEIWDEGWHFTGACEPDPHGLDRGWFVGDAALAKKESFEHAIYAASFQKTRLNFPLVWARDNKDVPAENVTARYTEYSRKSSEALKALRNALATHRGSLLDLVGKDFATVPLTKADAAAARDLIWKSHRALIQKERADEIKNRLLKDGKLEMPFFFKMFGEKPKEGHSLWISLHGGGGAPKRVNDQQWENQKKLYTVAEGIYLAPRAPTDTWNLWHQDHIDRLFGRLIEDMIVLEDVNPDRVYVLGYSAGGDGVYQLAPRMADHWAAAAMMAGHPNGVSLLSLRNVPFALQVGGNDSAYNRNKVAREYGEQFARLRKDDPKGYEQLVKIHEGKGHWMDREDRAALPWMAKFTRNPVPDRVVWKQTGVPHERSYWLAVPAGEAKNDSLVIASRAGQTITIEASEKVNKLLVRLDDRMMDLDREVEVTRAGKEMFAGRVPRTVGVMLRTLAGRGDPRLMFDAEIAVELPADGVRAAAAEPIGPHLYGEMRWRMIGPFRGGRTVGATGVPGQPNVFYIGVNNGGLWKTTDYGHTWTPIFDDQPTGSIGALAVAPSKPEVIYVGSGEGLQRPDLSVGDGVYKSTDGGKTWKHLGLRDGQQIPALLVDPRDPDRVFVAVLGHPYGANQERGVFRSTNGGKSWEKVLYKDENTGAVALAFDPTNARTVYAALWSSRQGPWENGAWQGSGSGLYKSTDGGTTWQPLTKGLPTAKEGLGRIGIGIAPSDSKRMYALVDARQDGGLYRSEDAGESWKHINSDRRVWGRGSDFAEVKVDPRNKDIVYSANITLLRSTDGGQSFRIFKGAPGGDDYHTVWINPDDPRIILTASDQGAVITVNGGQTWSSWYNQPTAQFYHVITDNQFPYWVYGGQQESGSAGVCSRGRDGQITFRDWHPVGVEEYGYVAPDPLHPNLIYGGKVTRFDSRTGQVQHVGPEALRTGKYRFLRTAPLVFSTVDPHTLYLGANVLFKTTNGGHGWEIISPDLSREAPDVPESIGIFRTPQLAKQPRRGVIYTVAPSYKDADVIWCGTDDGLIHRTRDGGKTWANVTPPEVTSWSKISILDAGRFDAATAYAAVNRIRLDDLRPHIYRTHDGGKTWTGIVKGLPTYDPVNTVREDPVRKGLLFAGTERAVYVSFNDGDDWYPLRLNMPATSIRDLVVHNDDVVVGTHGRSFWILDDITPLRQINEQIAAADAFLFKPQLAYRVRNNVNTDTPLPPEEPGGKNPPDGAILNYLLKADARTVTLEIFDSQNKLVRRYSSADKIEPVEERSLSIPTYWIRPPQIVSAKAGMHRFIWDLHYPPLEGSRGRTYGMAAVYHDTPAGPFGPWIHPGAYTVKLTVDGQSQTQPLTVQMDPRVKTPAADLEKQFLISIRCYEGARQLRTTLAQTRQLREQLKTARERAGESDLREALDALDRKVAALEGTPSPRGRPGMFRSEDTPPTLHKLSGDLSALMNLVQGADMPPTTQEIAAFDSSTKSLSELFSRWNDLKTKELKSVNEKLRQARLPAIRLEMKESRSP